jgi:hypothetical protein
METWMKNEGKRRLGIEGRKWGVRRIKDRKGRE